MDRVYIRPPVRVPGYREGLAHHTHVVIVRLSGVTFMRHFAASMEEAEQKKKEYERYYLS